MCMIVDANVATLLLGQGAADAGAPVREWIARRGGRIVHGGQLTKELTTNSKVKRYLRELARAGKAVQVPAHRIDAEIKHLLHGCRSNDRHVIAIARVSGARLLFSSDQLLHVDFTNANLIDHPRGAIYQNADHRHLLVSNACRTLCIT